MTLIFFNCIIFQEYTLFVHVCENIKKTEKSEMYTHRTDMEKYDMERGITTHSAISEFNAHYTLFSTIKQQNKNN